MCDSLKAAPPTNVPGSCLTQRLKKSFKRKGFRALGPTQDHAYAALMGQVIKMTRRQQFFYFSNIYFSFKIIFLSFNFKKYKYLK